MKFGLGVRGVAGVTVLASTIIKSYDWAGQEIMRFRIIASSYKKN